MALPTYASTGEKIWHYAYLTICGAIFFFLIAPIVVVIPLSFNAEPYFTFTDKMLSFDPDGYSLRWYDSLLTFGMTNPDAARDASWWSDAWHNAKWISAAKSSIIEPVSGMKPSAVGQLRSGWVAIYSAPFAIYFAASQCF